MLHFILSLCSCPCVLHSPYSGTKCVVIFPSGDINLQTVHLEAGAQSDRQMLETTGANKSSSIHEETISITGLLPGTHPTPSVLVDFCPRQSDNS